MMTGLEQAAVLLLDSNAVQSIDDVTLTDPQSMEDYIIFVDGFRRLSSDALDVVELICEPPHDLTKKLNSKRNKRLSLGKLTEYLREVDKKRWSHKKIQSAFNEIRETLL